MEAISAKSLLYANNFKPLSSNSTCTCISPSFLQCRASGLTYQSAQCHGSRKLGLHCIRIKHLCNLRNIGFVRASSDTGATATGVAQGWLLEPVGDGNYKHIRYKVEMPGAYEIFSSEMIVSRVPDKADLVIPVATVFGLHARIRNKEGNLLVTDLDSTNGTLINEKRVPPGATDVVTPGAYSHSGIPILPYFGFQEYRKPYRPQQQIPKSNQRVMVPVPLHNRKQLNSLI